MIRFLAGPPPTASGMVTQGAPGACRPRLRHMIILFALVLGLTGFAPDQSRAQSSDDTSAQSQEAEIEEIVNAVRTDSPRDTIESFLNIAEEMETAIMAYLEAPSYRLVSEIALMSDQLVSLMDLEDVASVTRRETGIATFEYMMDIFGRIGDPDPMAFPNVDMVEESGADGFRIPETPLRIVRMTEGAREGEFLFAPDTPRVAPRFYNAVSHLPMESRLGIDSFSSFGPQLTGPLVPPSVVQSIPPSLKKLWLETPAWKVLFLSAAVLLAAIIVIALGRLMLRAKGRGRVLGLLLRMIPPILLIYMSVSLLPFVAGQVNPSGEFARIYDTTLTVATYTAFALLFWLGVRIVMESIILSPRIPDDSLDADLMRLGAGTIGILGALVILAFGGQAIGLPVMSVVAGLGIGGLAVALAVRPTFENLIGGVILYVDRPVRVGDFCSVGDQTGTVEGIGIRSTKLRALDRTVISIPNAQFADMQIVNWAQCDRMLINETIGVRYDTSSDQMRYLLVHLRKMLHAHPRIERASVRVRFTGFGDSALNIGIRVYAETREWNDFFAIREDIYLRIFDIVHDAGTDLAFPSQTVYMAQDSGQDDDLAKTAEQTVKSWRRSKTLPFPRLQPEEMDRLEGSLDYPPYGSPDAGLDEDELHGTMAEPLSAHPETLSAPDENDERKT